MRCASPDALLERVGQALTVTEGGVQGKRRHDHNEGAVKPDGADALRIQLAGNSTNVTFTDVSATQRERHGLGTNKDDESEPRSSRAPRLYIV